MKIYEFFVFAVQQREGQQSTGKKKKKKKKKRRNNGDYLVCHRFFLFADTKLK